MEDLTQLHVAIVGAGVMGLQSALILARRGASVTVLERECGVGGVWRYFANEGSRVQVTEPAYRLIPERLLTDFTETSEVICTLEDTVEIIEEIGAKVVFEAEVKKVNYRQDSVLVEYYKDGRQQTIVVDHVLLCVGGLQIPRKISFQGESLFKGSIVYGIGGEPDKLDMSGKRVLILGMGAFAVENARDCLFRGAEHVTLLARHRNQIIAQLWMYVGFTQEENFMSVRELFKQRQAQGQRGTATLDPTMMFLEAYEKCSATDALPTELQEFARTKDPRTLQTARESLGTMPTGSDAFFIGHALGKMTTVKGEVAEVLSDGVLTSTGQKINASIIVKCLGFEDPDAWVKDVVNVTHMHSPMIIKDRVWLCKTERKSMTDDYIEAVGPKALGEILNIPSIAPVIAQVFTELFCYFQARPDTLYKLLQSGQLPHVEIGQCTALTWSRGQVAMMNVDPELRERVNRCKRQVSIDMKKRWTFSEYLRQNQTWWRHTCKRITGNEESVPYLWEQLEGPFAFIDQMMQKARWTANNAESSRSKL